MSNKLNTVLKPIWLLEDKLGRDFNAKSIKEFIQRLQEKYPFLEWYMCDNLLETEDLVKSDPAAVLKHDSFSPVEYNGQVDALVNSKTIPIVIFSGENTVAEINKQHLKTNDVDFYSHLDSFLGHYQGTGEINLKILGWGVDYRLHEGRTILRKIKELCRTIDFFSEGVSVHNQKRLINELHKFFRLIDREKNLSIEEIQKFKNKENMIDRLSKYL